MYKVYCDFDATVTENDIWDVLFRHFGKPEAFTVWQRFNTGEFSAAECIRFACSTVENADPEIALALFESQPLRSGFLEFVSFCKDNNIDLRIVSDGFSMYIRPILAKYGLHIPYHANDVEIEADGRLSANFRNARESCRKCGACKCAAITESSSDDDTIVYVGDGYSDVCPVEIADVVFARDMLSRHCDKHSIAHHQFEDFFQIQERMQSYIKERPKYKKDRALKARKNLYTIE